MTHYESAIDELATRLQGVDASLTTSIADILTADALFDVLGAAMVLAGPTNLSAATAMFRVRTPHPHPGHRRGAPTL